MDILFIRLEDSGVWCYLGHDFIGALGHADDGTIISPTVSSFRAMLKYVKNLAKNMVSLITGRQLYVCISVEDAMLTLPQ